MAKAGQFTRHGLTPPCVNLAIADIMLFARIPHRTAGAKGIPQYHELLIYRPATTSANDLNVRGHMTSRMTSYTAN